MQMERKPVTNAQDSTSQEPSSEGLKEKHDTMPETSSNPKIKTLRKYTVRGKTQGKGKTLTKKQKIFADAFLDTGNGTQSALKAYDTTDAGVASVISADNLKKPSVIQYLEDNANDVASNMVRLALHAESEMAQIHAGKDVLDRAGYKPVDKSETIHLVIPLQVREKYKNAALEVLQKLKAHAEL